ncbi:MAG: hypothetical protein IT463_01420 [Planctomycetes bacterium]|nr:hypothetical protein [Planctomycetota bacterium]
MPRRRKRRRFTLRLTGRTARLAAVVFLVLLAAVVIGCVWRSDDSPALPEPPTAVEPLPALERIEGWVPSWCDEAALVQEAADAGCTGVLFFHASVAEDGSVSLEDEPGLRRGVQAARARGLHCWLTATNHGGSLARPLSEAGINAHVHSLLAAFQRSGCSHLDLDYESLSGAQLAALANSVPAIAGSLPGDARLSLTLQPCDEALRPEQLPAYRALLASPHIYTIRLMAYDYHWKGSLPGALYPLAAFKRLIAAYPQHRGKLTLCLPLYGYDWPRPDAAGIPAADTITLREVPALARQSGFVAAWMESEAELAVQTGPPRHWIAAPSLPALKHRAIAALDGGVPAVAFWHLGCGNLRGAVSACSRTGEAPLPFAAPSVAGWAAWTNPWREQACRRVVPAQGESLEAVGRRENVERFTLYRYNEDWTPGSPVYIPR